MTKPISAAAYAAIEAAIVRLLTKLDDQGTLTIAQLASEAGLSRATLYRVPELLDRFRAALEERNRDNPTALAKRNHVSEPEAEIAALRSRESDEMRDLRAANRNLAQHIQALSLLVREQEQQIVKLQLELSESARVVSLVGLARR
jgi:DNA-binding MurR/RpiR family transcriptional regulator